MKKITRWLAVPVLAAVLLLTACAGRITAATMHLRKTEGTVAVSDSEGKVEKSH